MSSLHTVLDETERALRDAGVWTPRADAEALTAHAMKLDPQDLIDHEEVDDEAIGRLQVLVSQRVARIPLAHITGRVSLGGIELAVGRGVFVPRRQTEPLLAWGLDAIRVTDGPVVVDLCTGSGAIALAVAHSRPDAVVYAVDVDPVALDCARRNADRRAAAGDTPIHLRAADVADASLLSELAGSVELVLANPPYMAEEAVLLPEWSVHHPQHTIYSGADGLDLMRHVVRNAARLLRTGGSVVLEHDDRHRYAVPGLLKESGEFVDVVGHFDQDGRPRFTTAHRGSSSGPEPVQRH